MIDQIMKVLAKGFTPNQVMKFLMKKFPEHSDKIQTALTAGFSADQVLKFLSGDKKGLVKPSPTDMPQINTPNANTIDINEERKSKINKGAMAAAGLAAGAAATPVAAAALKRVLPSSLSGMVPGTAPTLLSSQAQQNPLAGQVANPLSPPAAPTQAPETPPSPVTPPVNQAPVIQTPQGNPAEALKARGVLDQVDTMLGSGNDPETIAALLSAKEGRGKKLKGELDSELLNEIQAYSQSKQQPQEQPDIPMEEAKAELPQEPIEESEPTKIEKGHTVATPHGVGEVKEIRNGQAIVEDSDGKRHKVDEDKLIQSPIPEKDLADLYDDVVSGIEKHTGRQVSRNVEWAGYDEKSGELAYKPHGSDKLYVYDDIPDEDVKTLTEFLTKRKSTGSNFIGAWEKGTESPIGAAMYQLIKRLQSERGGKGNEYKGKYATIYDALEPAKRAAKERHAQRKKQAKA